MGEDAAAHRRPTHERPSLEGTFLVETFAIIGPFYKLRDESAFDELTEYLIGLSCRDQEDEFVIEELASEGHPPLSQRRAQGHRLALTLREQAVRTLESLDAIDEAMGQFDAVVKVHPPLLEAIFDVRTGDPRNLIFPNDLTVLLTFFQEADWHKAVDALSRLAALPVRAKLTRGPMKNETLRRAVTACRTYWRDVEGRSWSMSSLKNKDVRDRNDARNLQGRCEAFVSDVVTQCGIVNGLHDLCSAWSAVDKN